MKHIAYIVPYLTSRRTTSVITQAAEALLRPKISSICLTRHDLSRDDQRRPKRTQIAAKFGNRHHHSYNYTSLFYLRPPDQLKRIPSHHSKPDLKAKLKGAPITSLPFSEKCDSIERRTASLVCDCARQLLEREASSSRLKHSPLKKKSQVDAEAMSCRILELLDEAAESAAAEAQSKSDAAIQQLRHETTEKQKGHTSAIAALQKKLKSLSTRALRHRLLK